MIVWSLQDLSVSTTDGGAVQAKLRHVGFVDTVQGFFKDLRQVPGAYWDMKGDVEEITKEEGDRWHMIQALAGDPTDGYPGCPGIGVKRAADLLDKHDFHWEAVCQAYREKGLSDDDALLNARLAKILQYENYDSRLGQPILWQPPATPGDGADDGAAVQDEET